MESHPHRASFKRTIESLLNGVPYTGAFLDILISESTEEEHLQNIDEVLKLLSEAGLCLKMT